MIPTLLHTDPKKLNNKSKVIYIYMKRGSPSLLPTYFLHVWAALPSLVILPTPEEPLSQPRGSLDIHSLEAQSIPCVQPFHTLDIRDRPFHTKAQEILDILLRHPSGKTSLLRTWGFPSVQNGCRPRYLSPFLAS